MKKILLYPLLIIGVLSIGLFFAAYSRTIGKTSVEIRFRINEQLVFESDFGESPSFAIWFEDMKDGTLHTVYATRRAALGDWEGKAEVPTALPVWMDLRKSEGSDQPNDAFTGATPVPGFFVCRAIVEPASSWRIWLEVNLAGDFNDYFPEDEFSSGQPALVYSTEISANPGTFSGMKLMGMSILDDRNRPEIRSPEGITTAGRVLEELEIRIQRPKPKIINKSSIKL
jgi:hypothetical protein